LIKFEHIETFNFESAFRGLRNPMESWDKSDSQWVCEIETGKDIFIIGKEDMKLALKLVKAGSEHSKFTRQIFVSMDITAPDYWWKEQSTYKIGTVENSTSTMHKITSRLLTENDFSIDEWDGEDIGMLNNLNALIFEYQNQEVKDKKLWRKIIQKLPMSFNYKRTCTNNYQGLRNMYFQRNHHKLQEWLDFCRMIESLPYSELITIEK
jgi:hypothetical protein